MSDTPAGTIHSFEDFELDASRKLLLRRANGESVQLTSKAFQVLLLLVENRGELVTKEELMRSVWHDRFVEEANLTQTVSVLRKTLGETPNQHRFIVTETGKGYRFVAPVSELNSTNNGSTVDANVSDKKRPILYGLGAIVAVALIIGAYNRLNEQEPQDLSPSWQNEVRSIAVLPFKHVEPEKEDQILGIGMADAVIAKLSHVKSIIVRQTKSVMRYAITTPEAVKVGREINVDAVLEGNIQEADGRIRVSVRLFRVSDGALLWAENFDERATDIFALQDSISEKVASSLALKLDPEEREKFNQRYTENIEAYNLYLKGRFFWNNRTGDDLRKSIELFERALRLDENYALAWSGLADSYVLLQFYTQGQESDVFPKAKQAAQKALSLDKDLAEPHAALAMYKQLYEWDWEGAETEFKRAIAANPNYATAHQWYGEFLSSMGRYDESIAELEKAVKLDPLSLSTNTALAQPYLASKRYAEAIEKLQPALELDDQNFSLALLNLGLAYDGLEMHKEAIAHYQKNIKNDPGGDLYSRTSLINSLVKDGQRNKADELLSELIELVDKTPVSNYVLARAFAPLGHSQKALEHIEKAAEHRDSLLITVRTDRNFDNVRNEPRFQKILSDMKLDF